MKSIGIYTLSVEPMRNFKTKFSWNYTFYFCKGSVLLAKFIYSFQDDSKTFSSHQVSTKFHITLQHMDQCT